VIHAAAQPSHDWAAREPFTDFDINAVGTLNLLEATRLHAGDAAYIFTSTNKVYGDRPNLLPLEELETRWEIERSHTYSQGIREDVYPGEKLATYDLLVPRTACPTRVTSEVSHLSRSRESVRFGPR
jgi:nucleoside-diphosphate-sugar epimerase